MTRCSAFLCKLAELGIILFFHTVLCFLFNLLKFVSWTSLLICYDICRTDNVCLHCTANFLSQWWLILLIYSFRECVINIYWLVRPMHTWSLYKFRHLIFVMNLLRGLDESQLRRSASLLIHFLIVWRIINSSLVNSQVIRIVIVVARPVWHLGFNELHLAQLFQAFLQVVKLRDKFL